MCEFWDRVVSEGEARGEARGKTEGKTGILTLMRKLFDAGRIEDAQRASNDMEYCEKLLAEFGIA